MTEFLTIGEIAKVTRRSVHTLRWYEKQGLIPGVLRSNGSQRLYREAHIGWLHFLARLKRTGMSLKQMKSYAALTARGAVTAKDREAMLVEHRHHVDLKIAELIEARAVLDLKIAFYEEWQRTGKRPAEPDVGPMAAVARSG